MMVYVVKPVHLNGLKTLRWFLSTLTHRMCLILTSVHTAVRGEMYSFRWGRVETGHQGVADYAGVVI